MGYLNKHNLINQHQSGFRTKHGCQTAFIELIVIWMDSFLLRKVGLVFETWVVSFVFRNCLPFLVFVLAILQRRYLGLYLIYFGHSFFEAIDYF